MIARILAAALAAVAVTAVLLYWRLDVVDGQRLDLAKRVNDYHAANAGLAETVSELNGRIAQLDAALAQKAAQDAESRRSADERKAKLDGAKADPAVLSWACQLVPDAVIRVLGATRGDHENTGCPDDGAGDAAVAVRGAGARGYGQ